MALFSIMRAIHRVVQASYHRLSLEVKSCNEVQKEQILFYFSLY
jgi:hypothetical protein